MYRRTCLVSIFAGFDRCKQIVELLKDNLVLVVALTALFTTVLFAMLIYIRTFKEQRYDKELHRAQIEMLRETFENQIRDLTERLLATESRWRDVYQLQVSGQQAADKSSKTSEIQLSNFFENIGIPRRSGIDTNLVFVLTPFDEEEFGTFQVIRNVCTSVGLLCLRGDEQFTERSNLLSHILNYLVKARIVIANINGRNPNVMYELGIAHAIAKPTILIGKSLVDVPFDIQSTRIILYKDLSELERDLAAELTRALVNL